MTPDQRLRQALELTGLGRRLLADGPRRPHCEQRATEIRRLWFGRVAKRHNRIY
jgi:hypothetical protein